MAAGFRKAPRRRLLGFLGLTFPVLLGAASSHSSAVPSAPLSQRLFEAALPLANQSLYGQFVQEMAAGTLPKSAFDLYLAQDNLYLVEYTRAFAVLAARASKTDEMRWLLNRSLAYLHEHGSSANEGVRETDFDEGALPVTVAYTSFLLQAAWGENPVLGYAAVLPCQRLYDWLFATLVSTRHISDDNPYKTIIEQYADPSNHHITTEMEAYLDQHASEGLPKDVEARAHHYYNTAMRYEAEFWQQALDAAREKAGGGGGSNAGELQPAMLAGGRKALAAAPRELRASAAEQEQVQPRSPLGVANFSAATVGVAALSLCALAVAVGSASRKPRTSFSDLEGPLCDPAPFFASQ